MAPVETLSCQQQPKSQALKRALRPIRTFVRHALPFAIAAFAATYTQTVPNQFKATQPLVSVAVRDSTQKSAKNACKAEVSEAFRQVPVLMFHGFENTPKKKCNITPDEFRLILQELYQNGFFVISAKEFAEGDFSRVPEGKKPVLLTFDDARPTQFKYSDASGSKISKDCALGILLDFFSSHPDFGFGGLFFVTFGTGNFGDEAQVGQKLKHLLELGFEIGNHTVSHPLFGKIGYERAAKELAAFDSLAASYLGQQALQVRFFAYPGGSFARNPEVASLINSKFDCVFDAKGGIAPSAYSPDYDPKRIPRVEGTLSNVRLIIASMR
ncbi:MAG: polysaccharide deacetylase family protein [Candidatus Micrarchaeota archaeon]|nr:polysaccharide deacetylase family protein [Candidatus Micrarchaeota archaeon]